MKYKQLKDLQLDLYQGKLQLVDLVRYYIQNIQKKNAHLNAYLEVFEQEALQNAAKIQEKINQKTAGALAGLVLGLKDNILYQDHICSAASKMLANFKAPYTATALEKLLAEDAIVLGRLNCDEFAMGGSNEHSAFGPVKNPHDTEKVPGGSSGGSAAAVAADLCFAALGTDTGGSIRQPAAFCGIVGFKPSYGRVSRYGLIAYASSFDQIGPMTHSVADAALLSQYLSGKDEKDASMLQVDALEEIEKIALKGKKIAYFSDYLENPALHPQIKQQFNDLLEKLKTKGVLIEPIQFPYLDLLVPIYYILTTAEASSNLGRYTGVHYGHATEKKVSSIEDFYKFSRSEGFGAEVQRRIMLGTFVLNSNNYEAFYLKAQQIRHLITEKTAEYFMTYDAILTPTTPSPAFGLGEKKKMDPLLMYLEDIFTVHANITGIPALSLPFGKIDHLPIGLQIMGRAGEDGKVLGLGYAIEEVINN